MTDVRIPFVDLVPGQVRRLPLHGGRALCVVRIGDDVYALDDRCSHADVSLAEGDVDTEDRCIECWKHGSAFSLRDGEPQSLPATEPVATYAVERDGDDVVVHVS